ncbi:MAG: ABC transporter substrate-binding protein [Acidobacteria bacterium]|nr:ABC transporter substrate-binding protein [Acidobacteriota bacterium]
MKASRILGGVLLWTGAITVAHLSLNVDWSAISNQRLAAASRKLNVAYIPVTCHLTCPVTDYISRRSVSSNLSLSSNLFIPHLFQGFPEIKEALLADQMQAAFMVAPMAIALRAQGVPIKIVYLGHRYGSAMVVAKSGPIKTVADLRGKTLAIPSRFSDERLLAFRAMKTAGLTASDLKMVEMAPPDVAGALAARAIDAFVMGEPFPSQAEMGGYGRVLFHARQYWPDYISCVLVVRQDVIDTRPETVQALVDGIARSGLWLEQGKPYRQAAAEFVGRDYYRQDPALLKWALTNPLDRVMYTPLSPYKPDFEFIVSMMIETGVLDRRIAFEEFTDTRFAESARDQVAWPFPPSPSGP